MDRFLPAVWFALTHYAALAGLAVLSYAVGRKITTNCAYQSTWERAAVCTSLGLGAIAYLVFALCLARWLYPGTLLGILGVAAIVCASELRSVGRGVTAYLRSRPNPGHWLGIGIGGLILFLPYALLGLYPPQPDTAWDALWYHLVVAKLYVQHHGFVFAPYVHLSLLPQLTEMLFTLMLLLFDDVAAGLVSSLVLAVLLVAMVAWGSRLVSRTVGYWASAILLGIPMVVWLGSTAYVDIALTLFGTMALYACWNWLQERTQQWLILAAVFAGLASGTKYLGLFFVGLIALIILFDGVRTRRSAPALLFVAIAAGIAAPWYARSVYYTGNPVFPFLSTIFGHGYWSAEEAAAAVDDARAGGAGRSVWAFVSLPWQLAFHPTVFGAEAGTQGPKKFFLLMPLAILLAFTDRRIAFLCAVALSYAIFWFFASQKMRFLVPAFPVIGLSIAAALYTILEWRPLGRRWVRHGVIVGIVCVAWLYSGWLTAAAYVREYGPLPVTQAQRDAYLARFLPAYGAVTRLNRLNQGRHYSLFPVGDETVTMAYFTEGTFLSEDFGAVHAAGVFVDRGDNEGFYRALRSLGADYVLLVRGRHTLREDPFFRTHFNLIYARAPIEVYEIRRTDKSR